MRLPTGIAGGPASSVAEKLIDQARRSQRGAPRAFVASPADGEVEHRPLRRSPLAYLEAAATVLGQARSPATYLSLLKELEFSSPKERGSHIAAMRDLFGPESEFAELTAANARDSLIGWAGEAEGLAQLKTEARTLIGSEELLDKEEERLGREARALLAKGSEIPGNHEAGLRLIADQVRLSALRSLIPSRLNDPVSGAPLVGQAAGFMVQLYSSVLGKVDFSNPESVSEALGRLDRLVERHLEYTVTGPLQRAQLHCFKLVAGARALLENGDVAGAGERFSAAMEGLQGIQELAVDLLKQDLLPRVGGALTEEAEELGPQRSTWEALRWSIDTCDEFLSIVNSVARQAFRDYAKVAEAEGSSLVDQALALDAEWVSVKGGLDEAIERFKPTDPPFDWNALLDPPED